MDAFHVKEADKVTTLVIVAMKYKWILIKDYIYQKINAWTIKLQNSNLDHAKFKIIKTQIPIWKTPEKIETKSFWLQLLICARFV